MRYNNKRHATYIVQPRPASRPKPKPRPRVEWKKRLEAAQTKYKNLEEKSTERRKKLEAENQRLKQSVKQMSGVINSRLVKLESSLFWYRRKCSQQLRMIDRLSKKCGKITGSAELPDLLTISTQTDLTTLRRCNETVVSAQVKPKVQQSPSVPDRITDANRTFRKAYKQMFKGIPKNKEKEKQVRNRVKIEGSHNNKKAPHNPIQSSRPATQAAMPIHNTKTRRKPRVMSKPHRSRSIRRSTVVSSTKQGSVRNTLVSTLDCPTSSKSKGFTLKTVSVETSPQKTSVQTRSVKVQSASENSSEVVPKPQKRQIVSDMSGTCEIHVMESEQSSSDSVPSRVNIPNQENDACSDFDLDSELTELQSKVGSLVMSHQKSQKELSISRASSMWTLSSNQSRAQLPRIPSAKITEFTSSKCTSERNRGNNQRRSEQNIQVNYQKSDDHQNSEGNTSQVKQSEQEHEQMLNSLQERLRDMSDLLEQTKSHIYEQFDKVEFSSPILSEVYSPVMQTRKQVVLNKLKAGSQPGSAQTTVNTMIEYQSNNLDLEDESEMPPIQKVFCESHDPVTPQGIRSSKPMSKHSTDQINRSSNLEMKQSLNEFRKALDECGDSREASSESHSSKLTSSSVSSGFTPSVQFSNVKCPDFLRVIDQIKTDLSSLDVELQKEV